MRLNSKMQSVLGSQSPLSFASDAQLSGELAKLVEGGFVEVNDAVVFRDMFQTAQTVPATYSHDLTGYECFVNHIHIEDYIGNSSASPDEILKQAITFALQAQQQLATAFPTRRSIFTVGLNASGGHVRFQMVRTGETWLTDDLEEYVEEAILLLES